MFKGQHNQLISSSTFINIWKQYDYKNTSVICTRAHELVRLKDTGSQHQMHSTKKHDHVRDHDCTMSIGSKLCGPDLIQVVSVQFASISQVKELAPLALTH